MLNPIKEYCHCRIFEDFSNVKYGRLSTSRVLCRHAASAIEGRCFQAQLDQRLLAKDSKVLRLSLSPEGDTCSFGVGVQIYALGGVIGWR